jgi:hypothetical protein
MLHHFKDITVIQADLIKSFAIFYLLLVGNYIGNSIFTCTQIEYISKHKYLQLFISFLLFYFLVTIISNTGKLEFIPPIEKLLYSIIYFIGFLILMRLDMNISAFVLLLIFIIYFLELNKDFYLDRGQEILNHNDKQIYKDNMYWITLDFPYKIRLFKIKPSDFSFINKMENVIFYVIMILLIIGFISYGGEIKDKMKTKNTTWLEIIKDAHICNLNDRKSLWSYFKIGLGIK